MVYVEVKEDANGFTKGSLFTLEEVQDMMHLELAELINTKRKQVMYDESHVINVNGVRKHKWK